MQRCISFVPTTPRRFPTWPEAIGDPRTCIPSPTGFHSHIPTNEKTKPHGRHGKVGRHSRPPHRQGRLGKARWGRILTLQSFRPLRPLHYYWVPLVSLVLWDGDCHQPLAIIIAVSSNMFSCTPPLTEHGALRARAETTKDAKTGIRSADRRSRAGIESPDRGVARRVWGVLCP